MKGFRWTFLALLVSVGLLVMFSACSASKGYSVNVVRYPDFWATPDAYHSLGVASVMNDIDPGRYVKSTNKQVLQELKQNGTYEITDLTNIANAEEAIASAAGKTDLVLVPTIVSVDEDDSEEIRTDSEGRKYTILFRYGAVEIQASLYDPNTQEEVVSKSYSDRCESSKYKHEDGSLESVAKLKECAVKKVTDRMIVDLVVMNQSIYFDRSITMSRNGEIVTKFAANDTIDVNIKLPEQAVFNTFTFAIQNKDNGQEVVAEDFTWSPDTGVGYRFSAREIYEKSGGAEKFNAVILSNGNLAYLHEFKIEKPKE